MQIKIKKLHPEAKIPAYSRAGDAGLDLTALNIEVNYNANLVIYDTQLAVEIPEGHFGMIVPRSGSFKTGQRLKNGTGIIDSNFRGSIKFMYTLPEIGKEMMNAGDRVGQLLILPYPPVEFIEVEELSVTNRNEAGFGSSGR